MKNVKYKFIVNEEKRTVIAISTYAGKTVKGIAKADPRDEFDVEYGKKLAAARCNKKVAEKRFKRASQRRLEARKILDEAFKYFNDMSDYLVDSDGALTQANCYLNYIMAEK